MPDQSITTLREEIGSLALEVALRDFSSLERMQPLLSILAQLQEQAAAAGVTAVAETASAISRKIEDATQADFASIGQALRDAVARMQQLTDEIEREPEAASARLTLKQDRELISDFIMESREHLSALEKELLALEQDPRN